MNENESVQEDEISLFDLWEKLSNGWMSIVGGAVLGGVLALLAIFLIPPKFEAVAVVQIGLIGSPGKEIQGAYSVAVEPPSQAVERMKTPSFQKKVAELAGDLEWQESLATGNIAGIDDLRLQVIKGTVAQGQTPLIELRSMGKTTEAAKTKAEISIAQLAAVHTEMAAPPLAKMKAELLFLKEKLANAESESAKLSKMALAAGGLEERLSPIALMGSVRGLKETELRQSILVLETALSMPATQPTKVIEEVFVSAKPISPKKTLLLALGLVGGLLAGFLWVFASDAWLRARASRAKAV